MRLYGQESPTRTSINTCTVINIINRQRLFPSLRWGSRAKGILSIFTELTIEMMNSVGPVMAS